MLAAVLKRATSVPDGWLARRLKMGQAATASQGVRRWLMREENHSETGRFIMQLIRESQK